MYLLNEVMLKPVGRVLERRAQKIQADIDASRTFRTQAEETLAAYEKRLHDIRHQAQALINEAIDQATKQRNDQMSELSNEGKAKLEAVRAEIAHERAQLIEQLIPGEVTLTNELAKKLLGESVALNLTPALVKQTLQEVSQ
jgi:F-type H+-transporting ATPase subunit b